VLQNADIFTRYGQGLSAARLGPCAMARGSPPLVSRKRTPTGPAEAVRAGLPHLARAVIGVTLGNGAAMAASGESCRRCGHVLTAHFDPDRPPSVHRSIQYNVWFQRGGIPVCDYVGNHHGDQRACGRSARSALKTHPGPWGQALGSPRYLTLIA
jgi:hypothetical protein